MNPQHIRLAKKAIFTGLVCVLTTLPSAQSLSAPGWTSTAPASPLLPRADFRMSACISPTTPDIINLLGGRENPKAWAQFNITSETFIDRGNATLPFNPGTDTSSAPQNTQQIASMFYFLDSKANLNQVDIDQLPAAANTVSNGRVTYGGSPHACLVAADNKLIVIGGNMVPDAAIFDLSSNVWSSAPSLNTARRGHACVHHPTRDELYVIGGYTYSTAGSVGLTSIERISVTGISSQSWSFLRNELIYRALFMTAIYDERDDSILVVGGATSPKSPTQLTAIQVISCESGIVSIATSMSYAVVSSAVIMVPSTRIIYVFGGSTRTSGGPATNQWQYIDISDTQSPTAPSVPPTTHPSVSPTASSDAPTNHPSMSATAAPSDAPSNDPSASPTAPSFDPTNVPSLIPTLFQSNSPTGHPSNSPITDQPTETTPLSMVPSLRAEQTPTASPTHSDAEVVNTGDENDGDMDNNDTNDDVPTPGPNQSIVHHGVEAPVWAIVLVGGVAVVAVFACGILLARHSQRRVRPTGQQEQLAQVVNSSIAMSELTTPAVNRTEATDPESGDLQLPEHDEKEPGTSQDNMVAGESKQDDAVVVERESASADQHVVEGGAVESALRRARESMSASEMFTGKESTTAGPPMTNASKQQ
mmetsp:Transcript_916/g.1359  ORF Transcript_916/g.1359 Transcript_916/m.1359 type:complete len:647 (+) Transcript_916:120-2060(+)